MMLQGRHVLFTLLLGVGNALYMTQTLAQSLDYAAPCEAIQPESQLLQKLQQDLAKKPQYTQQVIEHFWGSLKTAPIIEPLSATQSRLIFLWRGAKQNVRLVGGPSNDHEWLTRIPQTDLWFKEVIVDNRFIGSYRFAVDLSNVDGYLSHYCPQLNPKLTESRTQRRELLNVLALDPLNTQTFLPQGEQFGLGNENLVQLSSAPAFINPRLYPERGLNLTTEHLQSQILGNKRDIYIYRSPKKDPKQSYVTAIFFDGNEYHHLLNVPKTLDILVEQGQLPAIQAIFVTAPNSVERPKELTPNAQFSQFFKQELLPWIDQKIERDPKKTVLLGSSLGGLSSAYLALENPQEISHVVPMSGSFWWQETPNDLPNGMSKIIREQAQPIKQQWYISANSYESSRAHNALSIWQTTPQIAQDLQDKGHDVKYQPYIGGHSYAVWQIVLQDALKHFFKAE